MGEVIKFSGDFNFLSEEDKNFVVGVLKDFYSKVKRSLNNEVSFEVFVKDYKKNKASKNDSLSEKKVKYSMHLKVVAPTAIFEAEAVDWDLARTVHQLCKKIETEIEHRFHVSDQNKGRKR